MKALRANAVTAATGCLHRNVTCSNPWVEVEVKEEYGVSFVDQKTSSIPTSVLKLRNQLWIRLNVLLRKTTRRSTRIILKIGTGLLK